MSDICPCCLEQINGIQILPFTEEQLMEMHIHGEFLSQWTIGKYNNKYIYLLKISDTINLPFNSIDDIVYHFHKPYDFYKNYFDNSTPIELTNSYYYKGLCGHYICYDCYNMITENKCPCCRMNHFLKPSPTKTIQIGHILWEQNYTYAPDDVIPPLIDDNGNIIIEEAYNIESIDVENITIRSDTNYNYDNDGDTIMSTSDSIEGTPINYESDNEPNSSQVVPLNQHSINVNYFSMENCKIMLNNVINMYNQDRNNPELIRNLYNISALLSGMVVE